MPLGAMSAISELLFEWQGFRQASWGAMEQNVYCALSTDIAQHLSDVASATDHFDAFFEHFARAPKKRIGPEKTTAQHQLQQVN